MSSATCICIVCGEKKCNGKSVVENPSLECIDEMLKRSKCHVDMSILTYNSLVDVTSSMSFEERKMFRYLRSCRLDIMKDNHIERRMKRSICTLTRSSLRSPGEAPKPKEKKCVFAPNFCKWNDRDVLHQVFTDNRGQELIDIKKATCNDFVRTSLSLLTDDPGYSAAHELHYHNNCLRDAHRTCKKKSDVSTEQLIKRVCDMQIFVYLQSCLSTPPFRTDLSSLNLKYLEILKGNRVPFVSERQGKYLKNLIQKNLPEVTFTQLPNRRKSEVLQLPDKLGEAVDLSLSYDNDLKETMDILSIANLLQNELLASKDKWKFSGDLTSGFEKPLLLSFFLENLLFRKHDSNSRRTEEIQKIAEDIGQILLYNVTTDRQVKHDPKKESSSFRQRTETPLTVGLPLSVHQKTHDKGLCDLINELHLGIDYHNVLDLEKRIHNGVIDRMEKTGDYSLPEFMVRGKPLWFAIDNKDFIEDTAFGKKNTTWDCCGCLAERR